MSDPLDRIFDFVMQQEGGVEDIGDGMGLTKWGQTASWCTQWSLPIPKTIEEARANYRAWLEKCRLDCVCTVADGLSIAVVDMAVNQGEPRTIRFLQTYLLQNVDGVIGPHTRFAAMSLTPPKRLALAARMLGARARLYGNSLADPRKTKFARGLMNRLGDNLDELAKSIDVT